MAAANHYLVSIESVSASVGGFDISSIVEMQLAAQANDIPLITLLVDAGNSGNAEAHAVEAVSLSNARSVFDTCRAMVKTSGATLSLSITVRSVGKGGGDSQQLSINGWMLTDVSLSPIQESGVCTVALTFMHPLCKAHYGGAVPGLLATPIRFDDVDGSNPLEVFISALRVYGEHAQREQPREEQYVEGASDSTTVRDNLLTRLSTAADDLSSSLQWTGGGLPCSSQLGGWDDLIRYGLAIHAMPSRGNSVYQRFVKCLAPECSLAVGGDYTASALEVGPFKPWADASLTIKDSDIISLQFPQSDPSPLSGVKLTSNDTSDTIPISYHIDSSQLDVAPADIFYVPDSELAAEYLYGPIQQFQEPGWLSSMQSLMTTTSDVGRSDMVAASSGNYQIAVNTPRGGSATFSGVGGGDAGPAVNYSSAMLACAKAYYETSLMKDWTFTINTRLMFNSGGVICPGKVVSVRAGTSEVLSGYVAAVTHTLSVANRAAHSSIICTHPRFGELPTSITSSENAMYT